MSSDDKYSLCLFEFGSHIGGTGNCHWVHPVFSSIGGLLETYKVWSPTLRSKQSSSGMGVFSVNGQRVTIWDFMGHTVPVATPQLCSCGIKAVINNIYNKWGWLCSNAHLCMETKICIAYNFYVLWYMILLLVVFNDFRFIFSLWDRQRQIAGPIWPAIHSLSTPDLV